MKNELKIVILLFIITITTLFIISLQPRNNIECSYQTNYDDYYIKYIDTFYYENDSFNKLQHKVIYNFNDGSIKTNELFSQLSNNYQKYTDLSISSNLTEKKISFQFSLDKDFTSDTSYSELVGIPKDFIVNSYPDDLIKRYHDDYNQSSCKRK